jgi:hypothetical protein
MAELSVAHRAALAQIVAACPERALAQLAPAVATLPGARAAALSLMIEEEARDRRRRAAAFRPLLPLFQARADGVPGLSFPAGVLPRVWQIASLKEPALLPHLDREGAEAAAVADRICLAAAAAVRDQADLVWPVGIDPAGRDKGLEALAGAFDLAHLARRALPSLPAWIGRPDGDQIAELRLLMRDSAAISPDGAQQMLEMLFAHVGDAALILRVVTQTSGVAGREAFLSESEMAVFVDRLIGAVHARVARIAGFQPSAGMAALTRLKDDIAWCSGVLGELDVTVQVRPNSVWGKDACDARVKVAAQVSGLLRMVDKAIDRVLPTTRLQLAGRMTRQVPRLDAPVAGEAVEAATVLLALTGAIRSAAGQFGCEADRAKLVAALTERLSAHADQALELVNAGDVQDEPHALALIELVASFLTLIQADDAARTVRRRAAVAGSNPDRAGASPQAA